MPGLQNAGVTSGHGRLVFEIEQNARFHQPDYELCKGVVLCWFLLILNIQNSSGLNVLISNCFGRRQMRICISCQVSNAKGFNNPLQFSTRFSYHMPTIKSHQVLNMVAFRHGNTCLYQGLRVQSCTWVRAMQL